MQLKINSQLQKSHQKDQHQRQNTNKKFKCLICFKFAKNPVLTGCGHMFCWPCLFKKTSSTSICPQCKYKFVTAQCFPIFIDSQQNQIQIHDQNIPKRPKAIHKQKILNANMIGAGMPLASNNIPNNVVLGKLVTGYSFSPSLAFQSFNNIDEGFPTQQDIQASHKFRVKMHVILIITILALIFYVF